jgi:hypothetical protein
MEKAHELREFGLKVSRYFLDFLDTDFNRVRKKPFEALSSLSNHTL